MSIGHDAISTIAAKTGGAVPQDDDRRRAPRKEATLNPRARAAARQVFEQGLSPFAVAISVRCMEFGVLFALGVALFWWRAFPVEGFAIHYVATMIAVPILAMVLFETMRAYTIQAFRHPLRKAPSMLAGWSALFLVMSAIAFLTQSGDLFSRMMFATWYGFGAFFIVFWRFALAVYINARTRNGQLSRRAVVVGGGAESEALIEALKASSEADVSIVGIFDDRDDERSPVEQAGVEKLGNIDELVAFIRMTRIDLLIVTLPVTAEKRLLQMLQKLWVLPVDIRLSSHATKVRFQSRNYSYIGNVPFFDVLDRPLSGTDHAMKWLFDKTVALSAILLFSPVMLTVAALIRLTSKGPAVFVQNRYGFNNELIRVYKFRSMYTDMCDAKAAKLVTKDDPRVTPIGRFIRKTSIDELPQFFNVLKGDLAIVGPRPHAVSAKAADDLYDEVVDGYFARHRVKPGITGWAQVNGWRGETDTREKIERRVEHDLYYIENWSVLFDLYIVFKTPFGLLSSKNAY